VTQALARLQGLCAAQPLSLRGYQNRPQHALLGMGSSWSSATVLTEGLFGNEAEDQMDFTYQGWVPNQAMMNKFQTCPDLHPPTSTTGAIGAQLFLVCMASLFVPACPLTSSQTCMSEELGSNHETQVRSCACHPSVQPYDRRRNTFWMPLVALSTRNKPFFAAGSQVHRHNYNSSLSFEPFWFTVPPPMAMS
jgi:hypothetical protein